VAYPLGSSWEVAIIPAHSS